MAHSSAKGTLARRACGSERKALARPTSDDSAPSPKRTRGGSARPRRDDAGAACAGAAGMGAAGMGAAGTGGLAAGGVFHSRWLAIAIPRFFSASKTRPKNWASVT